MNGTAVPALRPLHRPLTETLARGASALEPAARTRVAAFLRSRRTPDGLFRGRGDPDLYFTAFGLEALAAVDPAGARQVAATPPAGPLDLVHLASLVRCLVAGGRAAEARSLLPALEALRAGRAGSLYGAYLAALARDAAGARVRPGRSDAARGARCRCADGGFADRPGGAATTPTTAAALVLAADAAPAVAASASAWLLARADARGGFRAGPAAPGPDLLSTAAALFALREAAPDRFADAAAPAHAAFVESCWRADDGFGAHPGDDASDVEYTWYALLALGALA